MGGTKHFGISGLVSRVSHTRFAHNHAPHGSETALDREFEGLEMIAKRMWIILPSQPFRIAWDWILIIFVLYSAITVPMEGAAWPEQTARVEPSSVRRILILPGSLLSIQQGDLRARLRPHCGRILHERHRAQLSHCLL